MTIIPYVPAYLALVDCRIACNESPYLFEARFVGLPSGYKTLSLSGPALAIIASSNGRMAIDEIYQTVCDGLPEYSRLQFDRDLDALANIGIIKFAKHIMEQRGSDRYSRHLLYYSLYSDDAERVQEKLASSLVTIIGIGGIGSSVALFLAAAGIGHLRLIDHDSVELSNLTRQLLFQEADVGQSKVRTAARNLHKLNSHTRIDVEDTRIDNLELVRKAIRGSDLVVVSADKPTSLREYVNKASLEDTIAWTSGGYFSNTCKIGPLFVPGKTGCLCCGEADGRTPGGTLDLLSSLPLIEQIISRFQAPSFGPLNGIIASMLAHDAISYLGGYMETIATLGHALWVKSPEMEITRVEYQRDGECPVCSKHSHPRTAGTC